MARLLLLIPSTSYRARDFLAAAGALDADVVVGSDHHQVLAGFSAGRTLYVDLHDPHRGVEQVLAHAARFPLDAVVGTDDESVLVAAAAARALGLRHDDPRAVAAARDKLRFREALAAAGVPGPGFRVVDLWSEVEQAAATVAYPCVLKPRSLSGSRGVIRADGPATFVAACARIGAILGGCDRLTEPAHRHTVLVEDYLPGSEVAVEGLLAGGRLQVLAMLDKPDPMTGPCFEETLLITPSRHPAPAQAAAVAAAQAAIDALGLRQGPVHVELRVDGAEARVIEVAPRSIGGLCSRALCLPGGARLEERVLRAALGLPALPVATDGASGVMMIPVPFRGRLRAVAGLSAARAVPGIEDAVITIPPGDPLVPLPEGDRYLGFLFARAATPAAAESALRTAHAHLEIKGDEFNGDGGV